MCGFINLFLKFNDNSLKRIVREKADKLICQRGPDDRGVYDDDKVYMSFHRLSIMDPSPAGHQPIVSSCGRYIMTFNGEIYNFRSLIKEYNLQGLSSNSDSEVLLELYSIIKERICDVIRGMYAFIIYDKKDRSFFGARDTFGIKPLYYLHDDRGVFFSSEIKPLLQFQQEVKINERSVTRYLMCGNMDDLPETFFKGILQVPAGHIVEGKEGKLKIRKGKFLSIDVLENLNQDQYRKDYGGLLTNKVSQYLYSDVPVGVSLSGGFDSSLLAYLIHANEQGQSLHMFCRGYENYIGNELDAARAIGEKFNFRYHEAILSPAEVPQLLETASRIQEHPITSISILAFHKLYKIAKEENIKVLLEGHGGDECWSGYEYYSKAIGRQQVGMANLSHDGSNFEFNSRGMYNSDDYALLDLDDTVVASPNKLTRLTQMQLMDMFGGKLQRSLRFVDRASMNEGIEVRLPFLDYDIVKSALCIPDHWKISEGHHRYFIRQLAEQYLGNEVAFRKKVPIQDPQRLWLQTHLTDYVNDTLFSENLFIKKFIDLNKLRNNFLSFLKTPDQYPNLTFLVFPLCLEAWYQGMKEYINNEVIQYQ